MARKRAHGEGTVYQRGDGLWQARLTLPNGKRKAFYGHTQKEALAKLRAGRRALEQGLALGPERLTAETFFTRWLENSARPRLRPSASARYESILRRHVLPELGRKRLKAVTAQDLQALYAAKLKAGLSPSTVAYVHRVVHNALREAVTLGLVGRNVASLVKPPRAAPPAPHALSVDEAKALLAAVRDDPLEAFYLLATMTGLRRGELLALRWEDVDLDAARLQVRRTLYRVRRPSARKGEPKTEWVSGEPKSTSGRRQIVLIAEAVEALRRHRKRQLEERLRAGRDWQDGWGLVFCNGLGRPLEPGNIWRRSWRPLLERAGLPVVRLHDLRHSAASLLLALGVHPKVVQEVLGHSRIGITLDLYSHTTPVLQEEAMQRLGDLLRS